jgi:hypothetical protein
MLYDIDDKEYVLLTQTNDNDYPTIKGVKSEYLEAIKLFRTLQREADIHAT